MLETLKKEPSSVATVTALTLPLLADYLDFRLYLLDYYNYRREQSKNDVRVYSYGMFASAANIKSPHYLKLIIEGQRNLSDEMMLKFAKALGFNKEQTEEFKLLVAYGQSTEPSERNVYLKQLNELRVIHQLKSGEINQKIWDKFPNWIGWILYTMMDQKGVDLALSDLKLLLRGKATEDEIDEALEQLIRSGRLVRDPETQKIAKPTQFQDTTEEIPPILIRSLQSQLMYLGLEALFKESPTDREFGSLTLSLTQAEFEDLKFQLRKFRKTLYKDNSIARKQSQGERVYQLNLQLFPVTDPVK